ncbi:transposase, partial [Bradyrhizobium manausense]
MQVKVLGVERRRRWSYDEKVRLVEETMQAGETVCGVARRRCIGAVGPGGMECLGVILKTLSDWPVPALDRVGRPLCGLVGMTIVAGIGG